MTPDGIVEVTEGLITKSDYEMLRFTLASLERENASLRRKECQ